LHSIQIFANLNLSIEEKRSKLKQLQEEHEEHIRQIAKEFEKKSLVEGFIKKVKLVEIIGFQE